MAQKQRSHKQWLLKTARETYGTEADHPFSGDTDTAVLSPIIRVEHDGSPIRILILLLAEGGPQRRDFLRHRALLFARVDEA